MNIKKHQGLIFAEQVLLVAGNLLSDVEVVSEDNNVVQSFDNCREQGLVIALFSPCLYLAIANSRYSDNIVVYRYKETAHPSKLPSKEGWNNAQYFDSPTTAGEYVASEIIKSLSKGKA